MENNAELNRTEFAVIIGLTREKWNFLLRHEGENKIVEAFRGGDKLEIFITGMKTRANLNGANLTQRKIKEIIGNGPPVE